MKRKKEDLRILRIAENFGCDWKVLKKSIQDINKVKHLKKQEKIYMVD